MAEKKETQLIRYSEDRLKPKKANPLTVDLYACIGREMHVLPRQPFVIPVGIEFAAPVGTMALLTDEIGSVLLSKMIFRGHVKSLEVSGINIGDSNITIEPYQKVGELTLLEMKEWK